MMSLTKIQNPKHFIVGSKTCWVFWGFEQLSSTIGGGVMLSPRHMQTACFRL